MSVANPLPRHFPNIGIPSTDEVDALELDHAPSSDVAWSYLKDGFGTHYINQSFYNKVKRVTQFKLRFSFIDNYRLIIRSRTNTTVNPPPDCIVDYLVTLKHGL